MVAKAVAPSSWVLTTRISLRILLRSSTGCIPTGFAPDVSTITLDFWTSAWKLSPLDPRRSSSPLLGLP
jgi:hypothetical protein